MPETPRPGHGDGDLLPGLFFGFRPAPEMQLDFDYREAILAQHQPVSSSQPRLYPAASPHLEEVLVLKLRTTGPANAAYLEQDTSGRVYLYFRGLHFSVDDYVPDSLGGSRSRAPCATAGQFICRQMLTHHGYHEDAWPDLARRFLLQHRPIQLASRTASKR